METTVRKESIQQKRERLKDLSSRAKAIREELLKKCKTPQEVAELEAMSINDLIVKYIYQDEKNQIFNTFKGWIKNGFSVRKGEKAFLLWGRKKQTVEDAKGEEKTEELEFFPVTYVFSNLQVKAFSNGQN